jgi:hypothetical protein
VPVNDSADPLSFYVSASVADATADELTVVPNTTIKFFENGEASANIEDVNGNAITELTTTTGAFTFNVKADSEISSVTLMVSAENYFNKTVEVDFGDKDSIVQTIISLAKKEALVTKEESVTAADGKLVADLNSKTDDNSTAVSISKDIELQDAEGNAISGTEVTLSIATAPLEAAEGKASMIDILPSGYNAVANTDATKIAEPAGYVEVNMNAGDTAIKKFSAPITISTNVNGGYSEGDKLAVTSFNEETGVWTKEEADATVGAGSEMVFPASFDTDHLTGFLLTNTKDVCDVPVSYKVTGSDIPNSGLFMSITSGTFSKVVQITETSGTLVSQADLKADGIAKDAMVEVELFDGNDIKFGNVASTSLCGEIEITAVAPDVSIVDESLALTFSCSNSDLPNQQLSLGGAVVTYSQTGKIPLVASQSAAGQYALNGLISGKEYNVTVNTRIDGFEVANFTITADGNSEANNTVRSNCQTETKEVTGTGATGGQG